MKIIHATLSEACTKANAHTYEQPAGVSGKDRTARSSTGSGSNQQVSSDHAEEAARATPPLADLQAAHAARASSLSSHRTRSQPRSHARSDPAGSDGRHACGNDTARHVQSEQPHQLAEANSHSFMCDSSDSGASDADDDSGQLSAELQRMPGMRHAHPAATDRTGRPGRIAERQSEASRCAHTHPHGVHNGVHKQRHSGGSGSGEQRGSHDASNGSPGRDAQVQRATPARKAHGGIRGAMRTGVAAAASIALSAFALAASQPGDPDGSAATPGSRTASLSRGGVGSGTARGGGRSRSPRRQDMTEHASTFDSGLPSVFDAA